MGVRTVLIAGLLCGTPLAAQQMAAGGRAVVAGTIYDSIARAPLARASVWLAGTSHTAATDRDGRFRFERVPAGRYEVAFSHPVLDSLGVAAPTRAVDVGEGAVARADLYVPSMWSMVTRLCPAGMAREASGLVLGRVRDAETEEPVAAATVTLSWTLLDLGAEGLKPVEAHAETLTQTDGVYAVCGVPAGVAVTARVALGGRPAAEAETRVAEFSLVRRDLGAARPDAEPRSTLAGVVLAPGGTPVAEARVTVSGSEAVAIADDRGRFRLTSLPAGTQTVEARRLGFMATRATVELRPREAQFVEVRMSDRGALLAAVRVRGRAVPRDRTGFEERMRSGAGHYLPRAAIEMRRASTFTEIVRGVPGARVVPSGTGHVILLDRATVTSLAAPCRPIYWVDGARWAPEVSEVVDQVIHPNDVEAVEIYAGSSQTPSQFTGFGVECGVIVVWTRRPGGN